METNIVVQEKKNEDAEFSLIRSKMHEIRGRIVMLDFDLAEKYDIETKRLKEAVRRNIARFEGDDFMFQLTNQEFRNLRSQFATSSWGGTRYTPYAFTELGVAMLSSVLNSEKAIDINRKIMRAFVAIRQFLLNYSEFKQEFKDEIKEINERLNKNDMKFEAIFKLFDEYIKQNKLYKERSKIGFKQSNK
jgi:hypothetical protein